MKRLALIRVGFFVFLANINAQVLVYFIRLCRHFLTCNVVVLAWRHFFVNELDWEFGRGLFAFARHSKRHQTLFNHFNAEGFALTNHRVTVIVWYKSIECLVHFLKLYVLSVDQIFAVELFNQAIASSLIRTHDLHRLHVFFNHGICQLHMFTEVNSGRQFF